MGTSRKPPPRRDSLLDAIDAKDPGQLRELRKLEGQLHAAQAALRLEQVKRQQAEQELEATAALLQFSRSVQDHETHLEIKPPKRGKPGRSQTTPIICCTDWHTEERVDPRVVNGVNEFTLSIANERITRLWHKVAYFINFWRELADIRDAVLWLGGDLVTGDIHDELLETAQCGPIDATSLVVDHVEAGIKYLLQHANLDRIHVVCNGGNHGRTTQKIRHATAYQHSYETAAYLRMQDRCSALSEVSFTISRSYHAYVSLYDRWTVRTHHGTNIKYQGGIGGIDIPTAKAIRAWNEIRLASFDLFGHWHQFKDDWRYVSCGSLIGFNSFAVAIKAAYQPPTQCLVMVDRDHGKCAALPVFLTDVK